MKIVPVPGTPQPLAAAIAPGIYPYLGGSVDLALLRSVVSACGGAVVSGRQGAKLAAQTPGVLVDPAAYGVPATADSGPLFDYDEWLTRQQAAGVPLILTDTPRIRNDDRSALRKALERWASIDDPTLVVLPLEPWWLREGLPHLIEEVRAAGRPVAIVVLHRFNGLDTARTLAGLLTFIAEVEPLLYRPAALRHLRRRHGRPPGVRRLRRLVGEHPARAPAHAAGPIAPRAKTSATIPRRSSCPRCTTTSRRASFPR